MAIDDDTPKNAPSTSLREPEIDGEPNPYEPPKSLAAGATEEESADAVTYLRPLARRNAAAALTGLEGAIVIVTLLLSSASGRRDQSAVDLIDGLIIFRFVVSLIGLVVFLSWFYRKYKNLYVLGRGSMRCTPGWAVGYWFIPILNLMRPIQCIYDIWHGGALEGEPPKGNPLFGFWWAAWLISGVMGQITSNMVSGPLYIVSYILDIILVVLTIVVIRTLGDRQDRKARAMGLLQ